MPSMKLLLTVSCCNIRQGKNIEAAQTPTRWYKVVCLQQQITLQMLTSWLHVPGIDTTGTLFKPTLCKLGLLFHLMNTYYKLKQIIKLILPEKIYCSMKLLVWVTLWEVPYLLSRSSLAVRHWGTSASGLLLKDSSASEGCWSSLQITVL